MVALQGNIRHVPPPSHRVLQALFFVLDCVRGLSCYADLTKTVKSQLVSTLKRTCLSYIGGLSTYKCLWKCLEIWRRYRVPRKTELREMYSQIRSNVLSVVQLTNHMYQNRIFSLLRRSS